jgi:uncharacterized protein (TIGR00255 family)
MIRSMTGYGCAERVWDKWTVRVELRSVNHSDLRVSPRLPDMLRARELDVARTVQQTIARGHVYVDVNCRLAPEAAAQMVDREALRGLVRMARDIAAEEGLTATAEAGSLLSLPGVMSTDALPDHVREGLWRAVAEALQDALRGLVAMREAEGLNLKNHLCEICAAISARADALSASLPQAIKEHQQRLRERIEQLLAGTPVSLDPNALAQETAVLADKSDVSEETARMKSHLDQFARCLESDGGPVGLKLEFLAQEMQREANTMAAKLPSSELVQQAIEIKADVQRLREQARNVE